MYRWLYMSTILYRRREHLRTLADFARQPAAIQRDQMAHRLLAQIKYFAGRADALPEWREAARIDDPREVFATWSSLPILTKRDLNERFDPVYLRTELGVEGTANSTGGSTGEPTRFLQDALVLRAQGAAAYYAYLKYGWRPGIQRIRVWGSQRDIGRTTPRIDRWHDWMGQHVRVEGYHLTPAHTDAVLAALRRQPSAIYGFTSMLEYVARDVLSRGITVPRGRVLCAWNGGEMLFEEQIELFRQAFGVPILNLYGGRELGAMAYQPPGQTSLHVMRPFRMVEVVDDDGRPVAPGQVGRLIWTDTICRGTPFLRYDNGDLGAADPAAVHEAGIGALSTLHGRRAGLITLPDGEVIQNLFWNHLFKGYPEVEQFQVAVKAAGQLEIRLVGGGLTPQRSAELEATLINFLHGAPHSIVWREQLPLTARGKREQVVHEP